MIHDLATQNLTDPPDYDLCIVGSGPAGGTLANELVDSGLRIAVLESGGTQTSRRTDRLRHVMWEGLPIRESSRERVLGGASTTWGGISSPLDPIDFSHRPWVRHAIDWPLQRDELVPYWRQAAERYRFPALEWFATDRGDGASFQRTGTDLSSTWQRVTEKVFLAADQPQDFGRDLRHLYESPNVDLYLNTTVVRFASEITRPSVRAVTAITPSGRKVDFPARAFVLACGGIENARLLLASRNLCPSGLGNEHDQVGRYFMNHPKGYHGVLNLHSRVRDASYFFGRLYHGFTGYRGLRLAEPVQRELGVLNSYVRFHPLFPWTGDPGVEALGAIRKRSLPPARRARLAALIAAHFPRVAQYGWSRLRHPSGPPIRRIRLRNFLEMEPDPENRVTLSRRVVDDFGQPVATVRSRCTELDRYSLAALHAVLADELAANGVGTLETQLGRGSWSVDLDASHHLGTTRMGDDPRRAVTDANLKLHGAQNVFVAGSSTFPTGGCANPVFTIVALSIRLAEHLRRSIPKLPGVATSARSADTLRP